MLWDYRNMSWNLRLGFVCYLHKDGCLLLHLLFHSLQSEWKIIWGNINCSIWTQFTYNNSWKGNKETILALLSRSGECCNLFCKTFTLIYRVFSFTWPAYMQIYWNKRKYLHKKTVQLPEDWFGTLTWPLFHCFGTSIWPPWRHVKTLYKLVHSNRICGNLTFHEQCNYVGRKWYWY